MSYISQTKEFIAQAKSLIDSGAIEARVREKLCIISENNVPS